MKKAVALKYDLSSSKAPKVTAKGNQNSAKKIIQLAKEHNIPIKEDENLVNMLSSIELEHEIPQEMYKAVAEIFAWIYNSQK